MIVLLYELHRVTLLVIPPANNKNCSVSDNFDSNSDTKSIVCIIIN